MPVLTVHHQRDLTLDPGTHPRGQAHLSAASGLVRLPGKFAGQFVVVADDEHHMGVVDESGAAPVRLLRLFEGDLPDSKKKRKALKPDLETLLELPPMPGYAAGALLALGSGSRPNRQTGVLFPVDGLEDAAAARSVDLGPLYAPLTEQFKHLNIEGGFVAGGEFRLLQRGSKKDRSNACISFDWDAVASWLQGRAAAPLATSMRHYALGEINGVPLAFTDGAALPDGCWVFSAVAEDSDDSYEDAPCAGAAVGCVGEDRLLRWIRTIEPAWKIEGIAARLADGVLTLTMVTDADDPEVPSHLLRATLPTA